MTKILIVHYSRTGTTHAVAKKIAQACHADLEAIIEVSGRTGWLGFVRSAWQAALHLDTPIHLAVHQPADYDLVVIGTPVWLWNMASPVRAYIKRHRGQFRQRGFFCACDGSGQAMVLADLARLAGQSVQAHLALTRAEIDASQTGGAIRKFVAALHTSARVSSRRQDRARKRAQWASGVQNPVTHRP